MRKKYYCIDCEKECSYYSANYGQGRCQSCATKYLIKTKGHPFLNKKHSLKTKKKQSLIKKGKNNPNYIDGRKNKKYKCKDCKKFITVSGGYYGKGHCKKCASHHRPKRKYRDITGKKNPMYGKKAPHGKRVYYKKVCMRSLLELSYAKYLEKKRIKWVYEPKAFAIIYQYKNETKEGTYRPDFYLPIEDKYIEVKGFWRDDAHIKFRAFKYQYPGIKIELINKKRLDELVEE